MAYGRKEDLILTGLNMAHTGKGNKNLFRRMAMHKYLSVMLLPVALYYIIFHYIPMWGLVIAFQDYKVFGGVFASDFVGLKHFATFFSGRIVWQVIGNTIILNVLSLIFFFPLPIIFALLLNEITQLRVKKTVQTITYMPYFISTVVIVSMITVLLSPTSTSGIVNQLITRLGGSPIYFMGEARYFRTIYLASGIWSGTGWSSIIYLAAISSIDPNLYEASFMDGAGRFQQAIHITIPSIASTIAILLILRMGEMLGSNFEKILLMQNPMNRDVAEVIVTYVYKRGILDSQFSFATAVGLFNSIVSLVLIVLANTVSRKLFQSSLW
jgi:putative aldouronate transport system permease protein